MKSFLETSAESARLPLGYARDGDVVTLRMSVEDYQMLLMALGMEAGARSKDPSRFWPFMALANRLNVGNDGWTTYAIPEE